MPLHHIDRHFKQKQGVNKRELIGCAQCPFKFSIRDEMMEHLFEHRNVGISCDMCPGLDKFYKYTSFREHYSSVHKLFEKKYKCEDCGNGRRFTEKRLLIGQRIRVHGAEGWRCEKCGMSFDARWKLGRHVKEVHEGVVFQKEWRCEGEEGCGEVFKSERMLKRHMKGGRGVKMWGV